MPASAPHTGALWLPKQRRGSGPHMHGTSSALSWTTSIRRWWRNAMGAGVSFVVPVRNGARFLHQTISSILAQRDGRPFEIVVVDDGSTDESVRITEDFGATEGIRVIRRSGRGAAAAINAGIAAASYPVICQVDQDVQLQSGWMQVLTHALEDPQVGAAQGYFATDSNVPICARVMSLDLEQRYASLDAETDHACTGNSAYRKEALQQVGLFDETLGYGYDNDMSYRLRAAGYRLAFCSHARSMHRWRDDLAGYLWQQYGFGYGRIDLVAKHPHRFAGDRVSPSMMMLHPVAMLLGLSCFVSAAVAAFGGPFASRPFAVAGVSIIAALAFERAWSGLRAWMRFRDRAALLFPVFHLARDAAWVAGIVVWSWRRVTGNGSKPC